MLVGIFEKYAGDLIAKLMAASSGYNANEVCKLVHALKGISANMAAIQLARLCGELEIQARSGQIQNLSQQLEMIKASYKSTIETIKQM